MQDPPILHRDLKVENLLISDKGYVKLCDFGSATTCQYVIDDSWSAQRRSMLEDEMASHTTPMYRAPEMLDTWSNFPINGQADMWALGCILYYLCYLKHPFEDSAKLRIINGNYSIPAKDGRYECLHALIRGLLCVDPRERFLVSDVLERLAAVAESKGFNMKSPLTIKRASIDCSSPVYPTDSGRLGIFSSGMELPSEQPTELHKPVPAAFGYRPPHPSSPAQVSGVGGSGLFSSLKGYSGSIFKNIKDTSSKVISTVSQSMVRTDLDITYLTSRLVVMSFPAEGIEAAYRNHIEDVRAVLDGRHGGHYTVYNVSGRHYSNRYTGGQLVHINWDQKRPPSLTELYQCCISVALYLSADPANVAVIHCMDGRGNTALLCACLLMLCGVYPTLEQPLNMFSIKRAPVVLQPSHYRYLGYMKEIVGSHLPHTCSLTLLSMCLHPVPAFTQRRDGIRPFVEVWQQEQRVITTLVDYDSMNVYPLSGGKVVIPLNVNVQGDVFFCVYHARRLMGKLTGIKVAQVQLHTGYVNPTENSLSFPIRDLDDVTEPDRYPAQFQLTLSVHVRAPAARDNTAPWLDHPPGTEPLLPYLPFTTAIEREETTEKFSQVLPVGAPPKRPIPPRPPAPAVEVTSTSGGIDNKRENVHAAPARPPPPAASVVEPQPSPPVIVDVDFLNLNVNPVATTEGSSASDVLEDEMQLLDIEESGPVMGNVKKNLSNYDLLSGLADTPVTVSGHEPDVLLDTFSSCSSAPTSASQDIFSEFLTADQPHLPSEPLLHLPENSQGVYLNGTSDDTVSAEPSSKGTSSATATDKAGDPFADLIAGGWPSEKTTPVSSATHSPMPGSPAQPPRQPFATGAGWQQPIPGYTPPVQNYVPPVQNYTPPVHSYTPRHQPPKPSQPNYGRVNFDNLTGSSNPGQPSSTTSKPTTATFEDLLGSQGFTFSSKEGGTPKTMAQMKQQEMVKTMDPDRRKIVEWTAGKEHNIRALLCSLSSVLWDGAKWNECGMHQLVHHGDVKKMYRKACLAVHPDKLAGSEHEALAKLIFMELNEAYSEFENDPAQQNVFK